MRNEANRVTLQNFYEHLQSKDLSEDHITNLLVLMISLDKFLQQNNDGSGSLSPLIYAVLVHRMRKVMVVARIFSPFMNHNRNY